MFLAFNQFSKLDGFGLKGNAFALEAAISVTMDAMKA
jgi:hypothetical protein